MGYSKWSHITDIEIVHDIKDTQDEIDSYQAEVDVLSENLQRNSVAIYLAKGQIAHREAFIKQLQDCLNYREGL